MHSFGILALGTCFTLCLINASENVQWRQAGGEGNDSDQIQALFKGQIRVIMADSCPLPPCPPNATLPLALLLQSLSRWVLSPSVGQD